MPLIIAVTAHSSLTTTTSTHLTTIPMTLDLVRPDPSPTSLARAVNSVSGGKFVVLAIPGSLKIDIKQVLDVFQRDAIRGAASWRHLRRIFDGELEASLQTWLTHPMSALQFGRLGRFQIVEADNALHPIQRRSIRISFFISSFY